jgi:hypothetical protein
MLHEALYTTLCQLKWEFIYLNFCSFQYEYFYMCMKNILTYKQIGNSNMSATTPIRNYEIILS